MVPEETSRSSTPRVRSSSSHPVNLGVEAWWDGYEMADLVGCAWPRSMRQDDDKPRSPWAVTGEGSPRPGRGVRPLEMQLMDAMIWEWDTSPTDGLLVRNGA